MHAYSQTNDTVHPGYVSYSRGTETAEVEGLWLVKDPNTSVETPRQQQQSSPEGSVMLSFIVPSHNSMRDLCDVI